jgi:hypothetical protein
MSDLSDVEEEYMIGGKEVRFVARGHPCDGSSLEPSGGGCMHKGRRASSHLVPVYDCDESRSTVTNLPVDEDTR